VIRRSERSTAGKRTQNEDYLYSLTQMSISLGLKTHGELAEEAIRAEFDQLFNKKKALKPVKKSSLSKTQLKKILRSSMFLKEKRDGRGVFEKLKGRVVADGRTQDRTLYQDKESKTSAIESILLSLGLALYKKMKVAKVDVGGAYLNAFVEQGDEIYMRLSSQITRVLIKFFPELREYLEEDDDRLIVRIVKAMYGLVQSAALWYDVLTKFLLKLGFKKNDKDPCVMHKTTDKGKLFIIALYVDDILMLCEDEEEFDWLIEELKKEYNEVAVERGDELSYLGMALKRNADGSFEISMEAYIKNVLNSFEEYADVKRCVTPTTPKLFHNSSRVSGKLLDDEARERFHTTVARLLYLSKRGRPDIQLPVLFLCSRVQSPTIEDDLKLKRILGYLRLTRKKKRIIKVNRNFASLIVEFFIDASFATHPDGKGHTALIVVLMGIAIISFSKKQKIATKDSTEAEIVALSDMMVKIEWVIEFFKSFGIEVPRPIVYQDNKSAITLVTRKESGTARTRHLQARQAVLYEEIVEKESVMLMYTRTTQMIADVLTKPLSGELFYKLANVLMGWARVLTDFAETTGVRWNNSIVTASSHADSPTVKAGTVAKFRVSPETVDGVTYNGPVVKVDRKDFLHKMKCTNSSTKKEPLNKSKIASKVKTKNKRSVNKNKG
jgi:Reverse transcriptase (RNA-dependent DNA polymerase).